MSKSQAPEQVGFKYFNNTFNRCICNNVFLVWKGQHKKITTQKSTRCIRPVHNDKFVDLDDLFAYADIFILLAFCCKSLPTPSGAATLVPEQRLSLLLKWASMDHSTCVLRWQKTNYQISSRNKPGSDLTASDFSHLPFLLTPSFQTSRLERKKNIWIWSVLAHFLTLSSFHILPYNLSL